MNQEPDDFLQSHSMTFLEMAFRTDRQETIQHPDGFGEKTGDCGDWLAMYLTLKNSRIHAVAYRLNGCIHTNACANAIAEMSEGKTLEEAWEIKPEDVIAFLETLPEDHYHCAELAAGTFYLALADCRRMARTPWKKNYR